MRQSNRVLRAFLLSENILQRAKESVRGRKRSENVLAHKDQEQRCSRATLSQKSNSSTFKVRNQQSFSSRSLHEIEACNIMEKY